MGTVVVLIRHAKPQIESADDQTRPISEWGRLVQHKMDLYIKSRGITADLIWFSPFVRAKETAEIIAKDFAISTESEAFQEEASLGEYFNEDDLLQKLPDPASNLCVFMIGHGPSLMRLATFFVGKPFLKSIPEMSSALVIEFPKTLAAGNTRFHGYYSPEKVLPDLFLPKKECNNS